MLAEWGEVRVEVVPADFSVAEERPAGHGVYVARHIVHMLSDDEARAILRAWRPALGPDSRLVLIEVVVPENGPYLHFLDMIMLMAPGGRERAEGEFSALLESAGSRLEPVVRTASPLDLIVAAPAGGWGRGSGEPTALSGCWRCPESARDSPRSPASPARSPARSAGRRS